MNQLEANIKQIQSVDSLTMLTLSLKNRVLTMVSLELDSKVQVGKRVTLACKPTSIALANIDIEQNDISYSNQLEVEVVQVEGGKILSAFILDFESFTLESIVTTNSIEKMELKEGSRVLALIKAHELSIAKILDD